VKRYRSDWPEVGLDASFVDEVDDTWVEEADIAQFINTGGIDRGIHAQILAVVNEFETGLYPFPCYELKMITRIDGPLRDAEYGILAEQAENAIEDVLARLPAGQRYVYSKVVPGEPLYAALLNAGFEPVENRCLYHCRIGELSPSSLRERGNDVGYMAMDQVPPTLLEKYREQILDICRQAFQTGYSRHFQDPVLTREVSGLDYITALMKSNFINVPSSGFMLGAGKDTSELWGFSVVGRKSGLVDRTYTQLLSAVHPGFRRRGVYRGLTALISDVFPSQAKLLNVTHEQSMALWNAYRSSGKRPLADTVVLRRFGS
jgi:hypothetical protein